MRASGSWSRQRSENSVSDLQQCCRGRRGVRVSLKDQRCSLALALVCVAVALAGLVSSFTRTALVIAVAFVAVVWLTQDFGGIFTSQGTDVNSGPLIALLSLAYWPLTPRR